MITSNKIFKTIALLAFLSVGQAAWGLISPEYHGGGNGTKNNPYKISDAYDWELFTTRINQELEADAYYELIADLTLGTAEDPLTTTVGYSLSERANDNKLVAFKGYFDGGGHTLTVYMNRKDELTAPFGVISGATICNLKVRGTIIAEKKYIAGIVAYAYNDVKESSLINCTSSVDIDCRVNGDGSIGGLVGQNEKGKLNFINCIFDGTVTGMENTEKCGGFINWTGSGTSEVVFENCIMLGVIHVTKNVATFCRGNAKKVYSNVCYLTDYGSVTSAMKKITTSVPENTLYWPLTVGEVTYYIPNVIVEGINNKYDYTGSSIEVVPVLSFFGKTLEVDKDYTLTIQKKIKNQFEDVEEIRECGNYRFIIECVGELGGEYTKKLDVVAQTTFSLEAQAANNHYWTTFYSDIRHTLGEGAQAFTMDGDFKLYRVGTDGHVIPAKTAVVIISEASSFELTTTYDTSAVTLNGNKNILKGSNKDVAVSGLKGTPYVLGCVEGVLGFYPFEGETIPAKKAYYLQ